MVRANVVFAVLRLDHFERLSESGSDYSPLNDPSPNCSSPRPSVLLDDSSYEHWLIIFEFPERPKPLEEEMINAYVKTLASVVGSEEEAKKRIYSVCATTYTRWMLRDVTQNR
ncbi:hypothetical protein Gotur_032893 [Gossypium turneri]